jgi:hypothetical protein
MEVSNGMKMELTIFPDPLTTPQDNGAAQYLETGHGQYLTRTKTAKK